MARYVLNFSFRMSLAEKKALKEMSQAFNCSEGKVLRRLIQGGKLSRRDVI